MITKELLGLLDLTKAQAFCIHQLTEIVLVPKNKDVLLIVFQIVVPSLKYLNNS